MLSGYVNLDELDRGNGRNVHHVHSPELEIEYDEPIERELENPIKFMLSGKAIVTIQNDRTGNRFTYKIRKARKMYRSTKNVYFVSLLSGTGSHYEFIGSIQVSNVIVYKHSPKSRLLESETGVKAIDAVISIIDRKLLPHFKSLRFYHAGFCGRCARLLTDPESIERGFGPYCYKQIERN